MEKTVVDLERMYDNADSYGIGMLTQLAHALQSAQIAQSTGEDDLTIVAGCSIVFALNPSSYALFISIAA